MSSDEAAIRDVVAAWVSASNAGNAAALHDLMAEEVVFLQAGQPPMEGRAKFLESFEAAVKKVRIACTSDVFDVQVSGDFAFCSSKLSVVATPLDGGQSIHRSGHTLTIFHKPFHGNWIVIRDANMLTVEANPPK